jgi:hypothetical protein
MILGAGGTDVRPPADCVCIAQVTVCSAALGLAYRFAEA